MQHTPILCLLITIHMAEETIDFRYGMQDWHGMGLTKRLGVLGLKIMGLNRLSQLNLFCRNAS